MLVFEQVISETTVSAFTSMASVSMLDKVTVYLFAVAVAVNVIVASLSFAPITTPWFFVSGVNV